MTATIKAIAPTTINTLFRFRPVIAGRARCVPATDSKA